MSDQTMWGIRAGRRGEADHIFLKENSVALGWDAVDELSSLAASRDTFKAAVSKAYPSMNSNAVPGTVGQLFRFLHEMQVGDTVLYPSKLDKLVHIGRVEGDYKYDPSLNKSFPHLRPIRWLESAPRTSFSQGALYEIGSALTLFQVRNYADEFRDTLQGTTTAPPVDEDDSVAPVVEDIEQSTRDFISKALSQELKGHPLAHFVAHLLNVMGYHTRVSPEGPDSGIDIIAHPDELGFKAPVIKVQVKSTEGKVGRPEVQALFGSVGRGEHGLVVTLGRFAPPAKDFERNNPNLRLIDGEELMDLLLAHYDQFDPLYKGVLPLKKVYVPQSPTE